MTGTTFVILSFEGPDRYCHAGGLGTRVTGLSSALAGMGLETHLFFIGDPEMPGHEVRRDGSLHLHRWCQWISRHHPAGVYDGEEGKLNDWNASIPGWIMSSVVLPKTAAGGSVVVLAEEWQTTGSLLAIRRLTEAAGLQDRVHLIWNANNFFGFDRIDWGALRQAATITTVSRYMRHTIASHGVDARVLPNGIDEAWLEAPSRPAANALSRMFNGRAAVAKVARFDPDKRWDMAVDAVAKLKEAGERPLFLARGGLEQHGAAVLDRARGLGLQLATARWSGPGPEALVDAIRPVMGADMVVMEGYLSMEQSKVLFRSSHGVLANSGMEPFGLVGLEAMASGGVALVGCTGEDYVTHGHDAISLQTSNPWEIVHHVRGLGLRRSVANRMRRAARHSAARYTWPSVIQRVLLPFLEELGVGLSRAAVAEETPSKAPRRSRLLHLPATAPSDVEQRGGRSGREQVAAEPAVAVSASAARKFAFAG